MAPRSLVAVTNDRLRSHVRATIAGPTGVFGPQLPGPVGTGFDPTQPTGGGGGIPGDFSDPGGCGANLPCWLQNFGSDAAKGLLNCFPQEDLASCIARKFGEVVGGGGGAQQTPGGAGGGQQPGGNGVSCGQGFIFSNGQCVPVQGGNGQQPGQGMGNAPVRGRYGAGIVPISIFQEHRDCPTGMVLGKDNICYDNLRKSERKWPPPRKPLLTGGERNAITTAKRAMRKIVRTRKDFREVRNLAKKAAK